MASFLKKSLTIFLGLVITFFAIGLALIMLQMIKDKNGVHSPTSTNSVRNNQYPVIGSGEQKNRFLPVVYAPYDNNYKFMNLQSDKKTPVAWDPCRIIYYVINESNAPTNGDKIISETLKKASQLSGFKFAYQGASNENYNSSRDIYLPTLYGEKWAPVLFTWSNKTFNHAEFGQGGASRLSKTGLDSVYLSGAVTIYIKAIENYYAMDNQPMIRNVMLHEVGHLLGLNHSNNRAEVMYPYSQANLQDYSAGDVYGLSLLSKAKCQPNY
jgi:Matrixin